MIDSFALVDPVCSTNVGHNFATLIKYAVWLRKQEAKSVVVYVPQINRTSLDPRLRMRRSLTWCYESFLPVGTKGPTLFNRFIQLVALVKLPRRVSALLELPVRLAIHNYMKWKMMQDFERILVDKSRALFFPGVDYYTLLAFEGLAKKGKVLSSKVIVFRFMALMEYWRYSVGNNTDFLAVLQRLHKLAPGIVILAETEKYADLLKRHLGIDVPVTRIPAGDENTKLVRNQTMIPSRPLKRTVAVLGGARVDKGYFELHSLAEQFKRKWGDSVTLQYQKMSPTSKAYQETYELLLRSCDIVTALPEYLEEDALREAIQKADVLLLPYHREVYRLRGSAVLFDSLAFGKPLVAPSGTAVGTTLEIRGLGLTFEDDTSLLGAIDALLHSSPESLSTIGRNAAQYRSELDLNLLRAFLGGQ